MERVKRIQKNNEIDEQFVLTEEDIQALLESEEDIRKGKTIKAEQVFKELENKYDF